MMGDGDCADGISVIFRTVSSANWITKAMPAHVAEIYPAVVPTTANLPGQLICDIARKVLAAPVKAIWIFRSRFGTALLKRDANNIKFFMMEV